MTIALITDIADTLEPFVVYKLGYFLDQAGLIDLVRDFGDDYAIALFALAFDRCARTNCELTAAGLISLTYSTAAVNDPGSWKIGAGDIGH